MATTQQIMMMPPQQTGPQQIMMPPQQMGPQQMGPQQWPFPNDLPQQITALHTTLQSVQAQMATLVTTQMPPQQMGPTQKGPLPLPVGQVLLPPKALDHYPNPKAGRNAISLSTPHSSPKDPKFKLELPADLPFKVVMKVKPMPAMHRIATTPGRAAQTTSSSSNASSNSSPWNHVSTPEVLALK